MGFGYKNLLAGIGIVPKGVSSNSQLGDLEVLTTTNELYFHNGTTNSPVLTGSQSALIQNKELEDSSVFFVDNLDNTKKLAFQVSGVTTGTTRTFTIPDFSDTLVGIAGAQVLTNKTIDADLNTITNIENADIKAAAGIVYSKLNLVNSIIDADINASAAIARTKIASGTANHVIINDALGVLSSEAALSPSRGGTGISNNAASTLTISGNFATTLTVSGVTALTLPTTGTLVTLAGTETLSNKTFSDAISLPEIATPSTPPSGFGKVYFKTDNKPYVLTDAGVESELLTSAGAGNQQANLLYNGNFDVWQGSGGPGGSTNLNRIGAIANNNISDYGADQWYINNTIGAGSQVRMNRIAGVSDGSKYGAQVIVQTAGSTSGNIALFQVLENVDSLQLYNKTASFQVKLRALGNVNQVGIQFMYATTEVKLTNTIGSETLVSVNTGTFTLGTIAGQAIGTAMTTSGVVGVRIRVTGVSSGNTYDAGNGFVAEQAMVNLGATTATFQTKGISLTSELELCQRYFESSFAVDQPPRDSIATGRYQLPMVTNGTGGNFTIQFSARKRTTSPTVTIMNPFTASTGTGRFISQVGGSTDPSVGMGTISDKSFGISLSNNLTGTLDIHWVAESRI